MSNFYALSGLNVLWLLLAITGLTFYLQWKLKKRHLFQLAGKIPAPESISCFPLIGHALHFIGDTEHHLNTFSALNSTSVHPKTLYVGPTVYYLIVRPEDMEVILNSPNALAKDDLYRFFKAGRGFGLLNLPDLNTWRMHRKLIGPTFNQRILNSHVQIFAEQARIMTSLMGTEAGIDVFNCVMNCVLDCVSETSMGVKFHCQTNDVCGINDMVTRGTEIALWRVLNVALHPDCVFNLTSSGKQEKQILESFSSLVDKILVGKQESYVLEKQMLEKQFDLEPSDIGAKNSIIDHAIRVSGEKNNLSNDEITTEAIAFLMAGSDTSAVVVSFALICLALYPEVQQKVYEEIIEVVGKEKDVAASDLSNLKYTELALKESMRLFSPVPVFLRKADEDLELETCTLPKESGLILCALTLHRHPLYFKDPLKFIPERFTAEEAAKRHPYSYLPFSAGPRNCIGFRYGTMLVKCLLVAILRKYVVTTEYKSVEEIRLKQCRVLKPVLGFKLHLTPRGD